MMKTPNRVCILNGPDGQHTVTSLEFPVCHWKPEDEPLHLDVHETENGHPTGTPIAQSVCNHSEMINGKAVFKFPEPLIMKDEWYGFAFFTNADELALFNDKGEPVPIANKNAAVLQSSGFLIGGPEEDVSWKLTTTKE
jgi:hypothetical protein